MYDPASVGWIVTAEAVASRDLRDTRMRAAVPRPPMPPGAHAVRTNVNLDPFVSRHQDRLVKKVG